MKSHYRVVVIGGGIVGSSILYHLTRRGWTDENATFYQLPCEVQSTLHAMSVDAEARARHRGCTCVMPFFNHYWNLRITTVTHEAACPLSTPSAAS